MACKNRREQLRSSGNVKFLSQNPPRLWSQVAAKNLKGSWFQVWICQTTDVDVEIM